MKLIHCGRGHRMVPFVRIVLISLIFLITHCAPKTNSQLALSTNKNPIIGGQEITSPNDPIASSTVILYNDTTKGICTGSLINDQLILTAAHCVPEALGKYYAIFTQQWSGIKKENIRLITKGIVHPTYKTTQENLKRSPGYGIPTTPVTIAKNIADLAILKFSGGLPTGYKPVYFLTQMNYLKNNSVITLAGFGANQGITKQGLGTLRKAETTIFNSSYSQTEILTDEKHNRGSCNGDSGGPAFVLINGVYYFWGIASLGLSNNCNEYGVYTNALVYLKWLQESAKTLKN